MEEEKKEFNLKREIAIRKKVIVAILIVCILSISAIGLLYNYNDEFREMINKNILKKSISTENVPTIDLDAKKSNQMCVYGRNIAILNDKKIRIYNSYGEKVSEIEVDINNAIFSASSKYLAIAEYEGKNFYLLLDDTYLWSGTIEGEIKQIHVNPNGYIALVTTDATYKSIVTVFNQEGGELIKKYLSTTRVMDVGISKDNKYLALAEIDTSGTLIQSNIEVISIENTINNSDKSVVFSYSANKGALVTEIKYQDKNKLVCMYDDHVQVINENFESFDTTLQNNNITYASVNLNSGFVYVREDVNGLFKSKLTLHIQSNQGNKSNQYEIQEVAKEIYACENVIAVNVGLDTYFINDNGWLMKKVSSSQEIANISFSNNLAVIAFKDRLEIIDL